MKIVVMIFLLLPLSITRTYAASVCGYVFKELDKYSQQAFKANDPKYDRLDPKTWEPDISPLDLDGKGKGVISSFPRATPEIKTAATNRGLMQWWNALVLVKDRAEADQLIRDNVFYMKTDPLFTQLVLETGLDAQQRQELLPKAGDSKKVLAQKEQKLVEIWDRIYTNPEGLVGQSALQYRDSNGQWKYISLEEAKRFQFTESQYTNREINGVLQYFNQVMWVRTPWRGVVIHEHVLANRKLHPLNVDKELNALVSLSGLNKKSLELFYKQSLKDELDKGKADGLLKELVAYSILYKEGDRFLDLFKSYVKEVGEKERLENPLMSYLRNKLGHIDSDALTANQSFLRVLDMVREKILPALEVNTKIASAKKRQKDLRKNLVELKELIREQGGLSYNRRVLKKLNADGTAVVVEEPAILKDFYFTFNTPKRVDQDNNVVEESGVSGVIKASMVQSRVGQQENAGLARLSQGDIDLYEKLIAEKKAFSIEMRDQDGKIIGGGWGPIGESQYEGESVAYPVLFVNFRNGEGNKATQERVGILFAQAMKIMSIDLFDRAGFKMQDSVMVSNYTATVGGVYIPMSSFLRMLVQMRSGQQLGYDDVQWPANNGSINLDYIIELLEK